MKKRFLYGCLLIVGLLVAGCSSDSEGTENPSPLPPDNELVTVGLRINAAGGGSVMRAWQDNENANDNEMMNLWTVVVVNNADDKVAAIHACKPTGTVKPEVDDYVDLTPGTYRFYSFANIAPSVVMQLLGIAGTGATGSTVMRSPNDPQNPTKSAEDDIATKTDDTVYEIAYTDEETVTTTTANTVVARIDGNGFDPTATDNGLGSKGIPMSNVQTKEITSSTTFDLIVVRMMAKIELQLFNETGADIIIKSATLSNVTQNENGNLKLLPTLTKHDEMEPTHQDIQPNLGTATQADYTYTPATAVTVPANYKYDDHSTAPAYKLEFYVNESTIPTNSYGHFFLTLEIDKGGGTSEYRYALIEEDATPNEWNYIARNDYRIIPVVLDDYVLDIIPYDFPAIGVYPASVKEEDGLYTINFHDYGHFHLQPVVKKMSTGDAINYWDGTGSAPATDYWKLDTDWATSWKTYDEYGGTENANPGNFYRNETATADADEAGGVPVWYVNDGVAGPQWDPAGGSTPNYQPFIFGYIADPGATLATDKKVYHEFTIQLHKAGGVTRQMKARIYMILDKDQMLYSRMFGAPRVRHTHGY